MRTPTPPVDRTGPAEPRPNSLSTVTTSANPRGLNAGGRPDAPDQGSPEHDVRAGGDARKAPPSLTLSALRRALPPLEHSEPPEPVLAAQHSDEPHRNGLSARLNWLRAGVLGANDGIISTAHFSTPNGASSAAERAELADIYRRKGLTTRTARLGAEELTAKDSFAAHVDAELGLDPDDLTNPWHAAFGKATRVRAFARIVLGGALAMVVTFGIGELLGATVM